MKPVGYQLTTNHNKPVIEFDLGPVVQREYYELSGDTLTLSIYEDMHDSSQMERQSP
jgi:hypothetical protein